MSSFTYSSPYFDEFMLADVEVTVVAAWCKPKVEVKKYSKVTKNNVKHAFVPVFGRYLH